MRDNTKRRLALAVALMLTLLSLTACGGKDDTADGGASSSAGATSSVVGSSADGADMELPGGASSSEESPGETDSADPATKPEAKPDDTVSKPADKPAAKPEVTKPVVSQPAEKPADKPASGGTGAAAPSIGELEKVVEGVLDMPEMTALSMEELTDLYGLDSASVAEFVCKMPLMNTQASEYLLVKAVSGKADTVKAGMLKRQADLAESWKHYLPEQYELVQNYQLVENGDYLLFVVGENAKTAVDAFNKLTK